METMSADEERAALNDLLCEANEGEKKLEAVIDAAVEYIAILEQRLARWEGSRAVRGPEATRYVERRDRYCPWLER